MKPGYDDHRSFLLRIWRCGENRAAGWRVSLTDPGSGEQIGFDNFDALTAYLRGLFPLESGDERKPTAPPSHPKKDNP